MGYAGVARITLDPGEVTTGDGCAIDGRAPKPCDVPAEMGVLRMLRGPRFLAGVLYEHKSRLPVHRAQVGKAASH